MDNTESKRRKYASVALALFFVAGLFIIPGVLGIVSYSAPAEFGDYTAGNTAMENMTEDITELITQIIPVFVIIGIFGVIISMIIGMMDKFGSKL